MGTTARDLLRYPQLPDSPDVVRDLRNLAEDVEGQLHRAFPCTSTTRPTGVGEGFLIRESDTSLLLVWDGTAWLPVGGSTGDGGGEPPPAGTTAHAQYSGTAQSIPHSTNTTCAWPNEDVASAAVTRSTSGAGHLFTFATAGIWSLTATIRYRATSRAGEHYAGIHLPGSSGGTPLAGAGSAPTSSRSLPATLNVAVTRHFDVGEAVIVNLWQGTGSSLELEPGTGSGWVRLNLALVG